MSKRKRSYYIFCAMCVIALAFLGWAVVQLNTADPAPELASAESEVDTHSVPSAEEQLGRSVGEQLSGNGRKPVDETMLYESLREGATETQRVGERGSLDGVLLTNTPMQYAESKYNYLPNSPLIEFTDEMIWRGRGDEYFVKKDAMEAQARHIQEASIALSVSPRVEWEKTTGYRLVEIPENTLFSKMGMVSGDIVVSINGQVPDMEPMALMFVNMVAGSRGASTVVLEHRGVKRTVELRAAE